MKSKKLSELVFKHPELFVDHEKHPAIQTPPLFYFECGDGWVDILDTLFFLALDPLRTAERQYAHLRKKETKNKSSVSAVEVERARLKIQEEKEKLPRFSQIKEKFGGLRVYYDGGDETFQTYVRFAEAISEKTCDVCGALAIDQTENVGWITTRCAEHSFKR